MRLGKYRVVISRYLELLGRVALWTANKFRPGDQIDRLFDHWALRVNNNEDPRGALALLLMIFGTVAISVAIVVGVPVLLVFVLLEAPFRKT